MIVRWLKWATMMTLTTFWTALSDPNGGKGEEQATAFQPLLQFVDVEAKDFLDRAALDEADRQLRQVVRDSPLSRSHNAFRRIEIHGDKV